MKRGIKKELFTLGCLAAGASYWMGNRSLAQWLGLGCLGLALAPTEQFSFLNRVAIITGGSRGLGLAMAERLLREGAYVSILARDAAELERAKELLQDLSEPGKVLSICCDVTVPDELQRAIEQVESHFGRIDVLINNAGSIAVGPFESMEQMDFDLQINLQLRAVVHSIQLVTPAFRRSGGGHIANISSIGGMIPVPHMSTYCAAKFALAGLSESLAAELAVENIHITTVYPGLMRTGSPIQAVFKGDHPKEYGWFAAGDVMPLISVSAQEAAAHILNGLRHGDARVTYPLITKIGILGHAALPETYALIMRNAARFMPKSQSMLRKTGAECQAWLNNQFWYQPLKPIEKNAEHALNQTEKYNADYNLGLSLPS